MGHEFDAMFVSRRDLCLLTCIGLCAGFLSVMTASGGPFCVIPLMFLVFGRTVPPGAAVALAFTAGVCICAALTIVAALTAEVDYGLALVAYVALQAGMPV